MFTLTLLIRQIREFKSAELLKENKVLQAELQIKGLGRLR